MRQSGSILLISCDELGYQPVGLASPLGFLRRAGFARGGAPEKVEAALRAAHVQLEFVIEPPSVPATKSGWESTHRTTGKKVL